MHPQLSARRVAAGRQHGCRAAAGVVPLTRRHRAIVPARASLQQPPPSLALLPAGGAPSSAAKATPAAAAAPLSASVAPAAAAAATAPTPQEAVEILFAGYSDIAERLQAAHARLEQLEQQQQQQQQQPQEREPAGWARLKAAPPAWDAAVFLLFFLAFINVAGWLALWQAQSAIAHATAVPWWASLPLPGGVGGGGGGSAAVLAAGRAAPSLPFFAVLLKRLVIFFVPLTNTAVVLTFCAAAVKAALACLRAWD